MLFFTISGDNFGGRSKTVKTILSRVKLRRCAEGVENVRFYSNAIKPTDNFISYFFLSINGKLFKIGFKKIPHKSLRKILADMSLVEGVFLKSPHVISLSSRNWFCVGA